MVVGGEASLDRTCGLHRLALDKELPHALILEDRLTGGHTSEYILHRAQMYLARIGDFETQPLMRAKIYCLALVDAVEIKRHNEPLFAQLIVREQLFHF